MEITYFYRKNTGSNYSIAKVFYTFNRYISEKKEVYMPESGNSLKGIIKNVLYTYRFRSKNGINHITGEIHYCSLVLPRKNTVLTIHDIGNLDKKNNSILVYLFLYVFCYYLPLRHLKYITCVSECTKNEIIKKFPWAIGKIQVIPNPVDDIIRYSAKLFNEEKPRILQIGTAPYKNLNRTVEALKGVKCELRIIGQLDTHILQVLRDYGIEYTNNKGLTDQEIADEYSNCDIVSFPSLYEGFGMPVIEGFMSGRIVVTSNIEPMKTICGNGAILVDPLSVESIRNGFLTAIFDASLRNQKIIEGRELAKKYLPISIKGRYVEFYEKMMK
ncbi:MAG: glycosyltransferase family 4 protein [Prevotella sp.]|nr:glycosyltransferase family 4 protein [Prevotella sp.]